jgi:ParB family chromosome partitioning protein
MEQQFYNNSIFYIELEKIKPNPYQPRKEFNESKLEELGDSIRQYGVLQPIVVSRREFEKRDGGLGVEYELIAGERRLRASKIAGLSQIPAVIRSSEDDDKMKLELAIIENLQREDLNPVDRATAFKKLVDEFGFKHTEIAKKIGKSREYVSNSIRLLVLPKEIIDALTRGDITEGHTRPLLMLMDRPDEQTTLFREITMKRLTVREAEAISRRIAYDKVRKKDTVIDPEIVEIEEKLTSVLGTRVQINKKDVGGKVTIDFFSNEDLRKILDAMQNNKADANSGMENTVTTETKNNTTNTTNINDMLVEEENKIDDVASVEKSEEEVIAGSVISEETKTDDDDLYSVRDFSV